MRFMLRTICFLFRSSDFKPFEDICIILLANLPMLPYFLIDNRIKANVTIAWDRKYVGKKKKFLLYYTHDSADCGHFPADGACRFYFYIVSSGGNPLPGGPEEFSGYPLQTNKGR